MALRETMTEKEIQREKESERERERERERDGVKLTNTQITMC